MTVILRTVLLVAVILAYHDYMTRIAQVGFVGGYAEGMRDSATKLIKDGKQCSSEDMLMLIDFAEIRTVWYYNVYKKEGGAF